MQMLLWIIIFLNQFVQRLATFSRRQKYIALGLFEHLLAKTSDQTFANTVGVLTNCFASFICLAFLSLLMNCFLAADLPDLLILN